MTPVAPYVECMPGGVSWQDAMPFTPMYRPGAQPVQRVPFEPPSEKEPLEHWKHTVAPVFEIQPGAQGSTNVVELAGAEKPGGAGEHMVSPVVLPNVPLGHAVHEDEAPVLNEPVAQLKHAVAANEMEANVPGAH